MSDLAIFFGRFHPLVVHLPIGFLILAFLLRVYQWKSQESSWSKAISFTLLLGLISSVGACILGYLLSLNGGYETTTLDNHMWAGIATTTLAAIAYLISIDKLRVLSKSTIQWGVSLAMIIALSITGHIGGGLTHGTDYLTAYAPFGNSKKKEKKVFASIEEVQTYEDLVAPILESKCQACHRSDKLKGQLSFSSIESIIKGGKSGNTVVAGNAEESELIRRISLAPDHEEFMPTKGKAPLTAEERKLLIWWINGGVDFESSFVEMDSSKEMYVFAAQFVGLEGFHKEGEGVVALADISRELISELTDRGFIIRELVDGSNMLDVSFPPGNLSERMTGDQIIPSLNKISDNIVWLNLSGLGISDQQLSAMDSYTELKKIRLEKNDISDQGVSSIIRQPKQETLNLYENPVSDKILPLLAESKSLKKVYAWNTQINESKIGNIQIVLGQ